MKVYQMIANELVRYNSENTNVMNSADDELEAIERNLLPYGSGFDSGCTIVREEYRNRIKIETSFHHLNDGGYYTGWSYHTITITPCLDTTEFTIKVSGRNINDIKDYIAEQVYYDLSKEVTA